MLKLNRVYPVVDSSVWVRRLGAVGVRLIQLRVKDRAEAEIRAEIREAKRLCVRAGAQLIVNDYWQAALAEGCDFVHLGQGDLDTAEKLASKCIELLSAQIRSWCLQPEPAQPQPGDEQASAKSPSATDAYTVPVP